MATFGLPYANVEIRDGLVGQVCPICEHFCPPLGKKKDADSNVSSYANHYAAVHGEA